MSTEVGNSVKSVGPREPIGQAAAVLMERHHVSPAITVVMIDDSEDLLFLFRSVLERSGHFRIVAEAKDGQRGVAAVSASQPDLVLLDIAMPFVDGLQALPMVRENCPTATVVMLSAFGDPSAMTQRAMTMGANGCIHKGGRLNALPERLRLIVGRVIAERAATLRPRLRSVH